ncbi:unnamed protein product [Nippostrongylus brasiliensis]|uniref:ANF_receptor domain-containing protein n=1 Tax=Nippostrongylus brasiliensis TaxID=27835 RepID=A0A0N4Y1E5_NIPBR|nr:unnamed protein product [Nippostrongylus brasiliensis]
MYSNLRTYWWHLVVLGCALYIGLYYTDYPVERRELLSKSGTGKKAEEIRNFILKKKRRLMKMSCIESPDSCFRIEDRPALRNGSLIVKRHLMFKDLSAYSVTAAELKTPHELTWQNFNSRDWSVNKAVVDSIYCRLMIAMGFVMEAIRFDMKELQNILMIGLGGGNMHNFFSAIDSVQINLTTVEIDSSMVDIATSWFNVKQGPTHRVVVADGDPASNRFRMNNWLQMKNYSDEKYKMIILDACHNDKQPVICPVQEFMTTNVIKDMATVLSDEGVLTVNILCSRDTLANEQQVLSTFGEHFATCFLIRYSAPQQLLACTKRKNWSFREKQSLFMQKFHDVDERFEFGLTDAASDALLPATYTHTAETRRHTQTTISPTLHAPYYRSPTTLQHQRSIHFCALLTVLTSIEAANRPYSSQRSSLPMNFLPGVPWLVLLVSLVDAALTGLTVDDKKHRVSGSGGVVQIGHLQPNNPVIAHEPEILKMCARDLKERKILPMNYTLHVVTMESCNKYSGVEHAAYLHYIKNATVYFGPGCNNEMLVIGRLAPRWNVPIIAHMSGDDALSDRSTFPTLGSVALTSSTEMARATLTFLQLNNWNELEVFSAGTTTLPDRSISGSLHPVRKTPFFERPCK